MKQIYISDLDGTLLNNAGRVSKESHEILHQLLQDDFPFTVATARDPFSVSQLLEGLPLHLPMILLDGVILYNPTGGTVLSSIPFTEVQQNVLHFVDSHFCVSVFSMGVQNSTLTSALSSLNGIWTDYFHNADLTPPADTFLDKESSPLYCIYASSSEAELRDVYLYLKETDLFTLDFYHDNYLNNVWFLEVHNNQASKGNALRHLKELYDIEHVTAFGDSTNDLPLFECSDVCCAVSNAKDILKEYATCIIESNEENGVAHYLQNICSTISAVPSAILRHYGACPQNPSSPLANASLKKGFRNVVLILLDGLGVNILTEHLAEDSFLRQHMQGTLTSVFPPTTTAAATALETGLFPSQSGYLGYSIFWPDLGQNIKVYANMTDDDEPAAPYHLAETHLYAPHFTDAIKQVNEKISCHYISENTTLDTIKEDLLSITNDTGEHVIYVYLNRPDNLLHKEGIHSSNVKNWLEEADHTMQVLQENCKDTLFFLTADHGFTDIQPLCLEDYETLEQMLIRKPSIEPRAMNLFVKEEYKKDFVSEFNRITQNTYLLYTKEEVLKHQLFGPAPYHPLFERMLGDYLAVAQTPLTLFPTRKYMNSMIATHGGGMADEKNVPFIIWES